MASAWSTGAARAPRGDREAQLMAPRPAGVFAADAPHPPAKCEGSGKLTVVTLAGGKSRDGWNMLAGELAGRAEGLGDGHLLLDFTNVEFISSEDLGAVIGLHKRLAASG